MVDEAFLKNDVPFSVHVILSISAAFIRAARRSPSHPSRAGRVPS